MNTTPIDAREALSTADDAARSVKRAVDRQASRIVFTWGVVYTLAPLAMYIWFPWGFIPAQLLLIAAIAITIYDTCRCSLVSGPNSWRIGALWGVTFAFGSIWLAVLEPYNLDGSSVDGAALARQMWAYGVTLAMFVYVAMGLWIGRVYVIAGFTVALLTTVGILSFDDWYWPWCSVVGGGPLLATAAWLRKQGSA